MSWQLFDRLAAFFKQNELYRRESLLIDQTALDRITSGGQLLNLANHNVLLEQTNLQINRLERYKDFDQMDEVGEIKMGLDIYSSEASLLDPELRHAITIKAKNKRVKECLEELFYETILIDNQLRPMIRYLCKYGDFAAELIPNRNRNGIMNFKFMNIYNFTRIETKFGDLVGFFFQDQYVSEPIFLHPWQVMHLRLTSFENIYHPYGKSLLDGARKHFKQLRLMEDAALIYRITRAPEKRVFTIPVGNIPTNEVEQYIESIARQFKKKQFFDPATGDVNERWNPLIQEDDFWLPQRADGTGPSITTLPGAENLDDIKDIEYFKKKMVAALKIPFDKVGLSESGGQEPRSLSAVDPVFAKEVQWIQREVAIGLKKIAIVHLALKGFKGDDLKHFDILMTASSAIDELYRIETWQSRVNVIDSLKSTGLFTDRWILRRFTDMTDDEIEENEKKRKADEEQQFNMGSTINNNIMPGKLSGGPSLPPLGPGEPEPLDLDIEGKGIDLGGPPGEIPMPEDYNEQIESELLFEMQNLSTELTKLDEEDLVYSSHSHYSTNHSNNNMFNSGFKNLLNSCELDGLSIINENNEQTFIESFISPSDIDDACRNAKLLLTESNEIIVNEVLNEDKITLNDLPSRNKL